MGTKTVDETGVKTDERKTDEETKAAGSAEAAEATEAAGTDAPDGAGPEADADVTGKTDDTDATGAGPTGVGQGAGAVVSAGLGIVSLTGSWVGTVASARESLMGQLQTSSSSNVGTLIEKGYGNAWQATAMWGGVFALVALIVGVVVLARPAFGAPGRPQAPWIKSVAWAGVALGVIGLLLAVLKYTDVLLGLPSTG
ncbi:hypothetical protein RVN83_25910 [Streptomyces sp. PU10]|uniref:hypothetical protein n=1 Tax=Streptomyces TaxID=1883 RepID=UPI00106E23A4|nr:MULTISPECIES: hypothetical protein [Streptomyces]MBH5130148.1 hypothetical protein [Streptomyces sp. HB-N217]MDU0256477.1 hypothetical protein [Streptomyces sp. PU10]WSU01076.1 hypothetical protein OG368_10935 [Streptomyces sp. NBC_01124]